MEVHSRWSDMAEIGGEGDEAGQKNRNGLDSDN